jgi:hypothetical protein
MSTIAQYYSDRLNKLNDIYSDSTKNYVNNYVRFKTSKFKYGLDVRNLDSSEFEMQNSSDPYIQSINTLKTLNNNYSNLVKELKNEFKVNSESIQDMQNKIDELKSENDNLSEQVESMKDVGLAAKPFFHNERLLYYRSIIYLISIIVGIIYILYLLQSTPFTEVATSVVVNTKNAAGVVAANVKGGLQNDVNAQGDNSMARNMVILIMVGIVVIAVFYFIVYLIRRIQPTSKESKTEQEINRIANSCKRDKTESWVSEEINNIKNFLLKPNTNSDN